MATIPSPPDEPRREDPILPQQPAPAHLRESHETRRPSSASTASDHAPSSDDDDREATELRPVTHGAPRLSRILSPGTPAQHWYDPVKRYWRHEIRISVPHVDCRDHLGECVPDVASPHAKRGEEEERDRAT